MIKTILAAIGLTTIMFMILSFTTLFPIKTILTMMLWIGEDFMIGKMFWSTVLLVIINSVLIFAIERIK